MNTSRVRCGGKRYLPRYLGTYVRYFLKGPGFKLVGDEERKSFFACVALLLTESCIPQLSSLIPHPPPTIHHPFILLFALFFKVDFQQQKPLHERTHFDSHEFFAWFRCEISSHQLPIFIEQSEFQRDILYEVYERTACE